MTVRLLIADDYELVRAGLREFFRASDVEVVGEATTAGELINLAERTTPDVVLLSPILLGDDAVAELVRIEPRLKPAIILLFSTHRSPALIAAGVAAGVAGIIPKTTTRDGLIESIQAAADGKTVWSREELRRAGSSADSANDIEAQLTRRERQVLTKLVDGLTNKQIAQELDISYETVKEHVQHILRKIAVTDRTQAAVWAVRHGLV
ncbi:MAG: DNA-binding response regulator [Planctomycetaceae bacterium]|jgi:DNA-binding NarL/FixJ family response regulator|nr:DNA-binding response regulator [Planctomycetaceae bacterium]